MRVMPSSRYFHLQGQLMSCHAGDGAIIAPGGDDSRCFDVLAVWDRRHSHSGHHHGACGSSPVEKRQGGVKRDVPAARVGGVADDARSGRIASVGSGLRRRKRRTRAASVRTEEDAVV